MSQPHGDQVQPQAEARLADSIESVVLGYLSCPQTADGGYAGALLVTDHGTRPLHFAYVAPVRPSTIQKILYGKKLNDTIKVSVIATKLLTDGLSVIPSVLFVDAPDLLDARRVSKCAVARLAKGAEDASSLSTLHYDVGRNEQDTPTVGRIVQALEASVDLLDPFARLREALKEALKGEKF
ncbi:MAG: hypothetical protein ACKVS9_10980 [Phycisphaerae bacterium]